MSMHHSFRPVFVATLVVGGFIFSPQAAQAKVHKMPSINAQVDLPAEFTRDKKQSKKGQITFSDGTNMVFQITLDRNLRTVGSEVKYILGVEKRKKAKVLKDQLMATKQGRRAHFLLFEAPFNKKVFVKTGYHVRPTADGVYTLMVLGSKPLYDPKVLDGANRSLRELKPSKSFWKAREFPSLKVVLTTPKSWKVKSLKKGDAVSFEAGNRGDTFTVWFKGKRVRDVVATVRYLKEAASKGGLKFHGEQAGIVHLKNRGHKLVFRGAEKGKDGKVVTKQLIYYIVNRASGSYLLMFVSSPARAKKLDDFRFIFNQFGREELLRLPDKF
jgi:hypothetical protein